MISKIVIAAAVLTVAVAQHNIGYGHGHGHAVSSQNIVLHQTHGRVQHAPDAHHAAVIAHAPVVHYQPTHHASHDGHLVDYHASAQYGHGHGQAVSSQNIVLHQTHGHVQHAPVIAHHAYQPAVVLQHQPAHYVSKGHNEDYHAPAHYSFEYSVSDPHTGDIKSQKESREGDAVHGSYSLHEADGTIRRVEYTADKHSGFNAVVHREGKATHAAPSHHQPSHHSHH